MSEHVKEPEKEQKLFSSKNSKKSENKSENDFPEKEQNKEIKEEKNILKEEKNLNNNELTNKKEDKAENDMNINNKDNKEINKKEGSGFMITELLDINQKKEENIKNNYLKQKYPEINSSSSLQKGIKLSIKKTHDDIHKKFLEDSLTLNNQSQNNKHLYLLINNKKLQGKNSKLLKILKENEKSLSFNIGKLTSQQKIVESFLIPKEDKVDFNNREYNLKIIKRNKENLMKKLEMINEQIKEIIIREGNSEKKEKVIPDYRVLSETQEEYNKHLIEIGKKSSDSSLKYRNKMKSFYDKRQKEIDSKEKELLEEKEKYFKELILNEKKLISERKRKNDEITNRINKLAHEKPKSPENYIYNKLKEKFEKNQKKLIDKILMTRKEPVMRKNDFDELEKRVNEQKRLMEIDNEERKKKLLELWLYRSQTLPAYHHPLIKFVEEEEKNKRREWNEIEKKRKECNDLEKRNFKPPKVTINKVLRKQIENRKKVMNRDTIRQLRIDNKIMRFKFSPIKPFSRKNIKHQLSFNKIDNNSQNKKNKKILKPIKILSPKPKDYLRDVISQTRRERSPNSSFGIKFSDILESSNNNVVESLMTAKNQIEKIDDKLKRKKMLLNLKDGYSNDVNLVDQVGKLLVDSVQSKISVLSQLCNK